MPNVRRSRSAHGKRCRRLRLWPPRCGARRRARAPRSDDGGIAGLPLPLPTVPVHTVGCGGGSIAYIDQGGALRVGPESAGADPGPACYGRSDVPTVTDAHVALGHLGAGTLLGGGFPIDVDAAVRAIERLGARIGLSAANAARGILAIADATMARAVLAITAERAVDPAHVPLVAYGGAGGLHAAGLVQQAGMPFALVPPLPGAFSALGLALAGDAAEAAAACRVQLDGRARRKSKHRSRTTRDPPPRASPLRATPSTRPHAPIPGLIPPRSRRTSTPLPAATAQRSQLRPTASLRSIALVGSVPCRSRRCPAPRRIGPRRGQPERPEHPRDRRRIVDRRQHTPRARALRADQVQDGRVVVR